MSNKQSDERKEELVDAELILSPAMQRQTQADKLAVQELVKVQVAEIMANRDSAVFEPFFRSRQVAYELRRLQSMPERRVHAFRYQRFGCMVCKATDVVHGGLGMCTRCYTRELQLRRRLLNELNSAADEGQRI